MHLGWVWKKPLVAAAKNSSLKITLAYRSVHVSLIDIGFYWHSNKKQIKDTLCRLYSPPNDGVCT